MKIGLRLIVDNMQIEKLTKTWLCYNKFCKNESWLLWGEIQERKLEELDVRNDTIKNGLTKYRWGQDSQICVVNIPEAESWELNILRDNQLKNLCSAM